MKKHVNEVYKMGNVLNSWATNNATKLESQPKLIEIINLIKDEHTQLDINIGIQQQNLQPYTVGKQVKKENLLKHLFACSTLLYNHAITQGNQQKATKLKVSHSKLNRMKTTTLLKFAQDRVKLCREKSTTLNETGITPEMFEAFKQATTEFKTSLTRDCS